MPVSFCRSFALALLLGLSLAWTATEADPETTIIARLGGQAVTLAEFSAYLRQLNPMLEYATLPVAEQRRLLDDYLQERRLADAAEADALDAIPDTRARLQFFRQRVLAEAYRRTFRDSVTVTDSEVAAWYEEHQALYAVAPQYLIEHLVYRDPDKAIWAQQQLRAGRPYAELAAMRSADPDLIFVERNRFAPDILLPRLRDPVQALAVGATSELVHTNYGYHVVRLAGLEPGSVQPLAEVAEGIATQLRQRNAGAALAAAYRAALEHGEVELLQEHSR